MTWCAGPKWDGVSGGSPLPLSWDPSSFVPPTSAPAPWRRSSDPGSKPPSPDLARAPEGLLGRRSRGGCAHPGEQGLHPKRTQKTWPDPPAGRSVRGRPALPASSTTAGRGWWRGRRAAGRRAAPQARLPGRLGHIPPDSVTCGIAPPPRALPRLPPSFLTRHHCPQPSKPLGGKVSVSESALMEDYGPISQPPIPPRRVLGMGRDPAVPESLARASGEPGGVAPLPAAGEAPAASRGCDLGEAWQERGALSRFGADWPGSELRTAQSPEPVAGSFSPLILPEKRERLVGAATPGGVGRGGGEKADPKARTGAAGRGRARAESRTPHRSRSLGESETPFVVPAGVKPAPPPALHTKSPKETQEGLSNLAFTETKSLDSSTGLRLGWTGELGGIHFFTNCLGK